MTAAAEPLDLAEAAAVLAAVDAYAAALGEQAMTADAKRWLARLADAVARLDAVTSP